MMISTIIKIVIVQKTAKYQRKTNESESLKVYAIRCSVSEWAVFYVPTNTV